MVGARGVDQRRSWCVWRKREDSRDDRRCRNRRPLRLADGVWALVRVTALVGRCRNRAGGWRRGLMVAGMMLTCRRALSVARRTQSLACARDNRSANHEERDDDCHPPDDHCCEYT